MAEQQRIIGGGLLMVGVAVVLILIWFLAFNKSMSSEEAHDQILKKSYPAYKTAEKKRDYLEIRRQAQEILDTLDAAGKAATLVHFKADATSDRDVRRLVTLIDEGGLEKNTEGQYELDGAWLKEDAHRPLANLKATIEDDLGVLKSIRETARGAQTIVEQARLGSGKELAAPAAQTPQDEAPIMDPNPIYTHDAELYRVFGVKPAEFADALKSPGDGARAKSARLRWNQRDAREDRARLKEEMDKIPTQAEQLDRIGIEVQRNVRNLAGNDEGLKKLGDILRRAGNLIGSGLGGPQRKIFDENREKFAAADVISQTLRQEAKMLQRHANVRDLAAAFPADFAQ